MASCSCLSQNREYEEIPLTDYVRSRLDGTVEVHFFDLSAYTLSLAIGREPSAIEYSHTVGFDCDLRNVTVRNEEHQTSHDLSAIPVIAQRYRRNVSHFRRNDVRIQKHTASKYFGRKSRRIKQILNRTSKEIVADAVERKEAIVFENIKGLGDITQRRQHKQEAKASLP